MRLINFKNIFIYAPICLLFAACDKGEKPIPAREVGDVLSNSVDMGSDYKYQVFFDLVNNKMVSSNDKTLWDLGFETAADGKHIVLNTSKFMFVYRTGKSNWNEVTDTSGFESHKSWDEESGNLDSTAFGNWFDTNMVYIVDQGNNTSGAKIGFKKLAVTYANNAYTVHSANVDGSNDQSITISKDETYNFMFLSLSTNSLVSIEPPKDEWDIEFSQYTYIFYDQNPVLPYLVTGCLINRNNVAVATDTITAFDSISISDTSKYTFSNSISAIGYDWKVFSGTTYSVDVNKIYIIRARNGYYYKLHFINFYSTSGVKGVPSWEYQQL